MIRKVTKNNYRQFYKEYYGIEFGKDFEVHHIDKNRDNNNISNLLLLPKKIHKQFHFIDNIRINSDITLFEICSNSYYQELFNTIDFNNLRKSISEWNSFKLCIDHDLYFQTADKWRISNNYQIYIDTYYEQL